MNPHKSRARRNRQFHCESLEGRNLLSGISANVAAEVYSLKTVTRTITGSINGHFAVNAALEVTLNGSGNLSVIGETTIASEYKLSVNVQTHKSTLSKGTGTLSSSEGNILVSFSGTGKSKNGMLAFSTKGKVKGGTGEFSGATGTFTANGTSSVGVVGSFELNVKLKTKTPAA
jgi:hypothetical protein